MKRLLTFFFFSIFTPRTFPLYDLNLPDVNAFLKENFSDKELEEYKKSKQKDASILYYFLNKKLKTKNHSFTELEPLLSIVLRHNELRDIFWECVQKYPEEVADYVKKYLNSGQKICTNYYTNAANHTHHIEYDLVTIVDYTLAINKNINRKFTLHFIKDEILEYCRKKNSPKKKHKSEEYFSRFLQRLDRILMQENFSNDSLTFEEVKTYITNPFKEDLSEEKFELLLQLFATHGIVIPTDYKGGDRKSFVDPIYNNYFCILREKSLQKKKPIRSQLKFVLKHNEKLSKKTFSKKSSMLDTEDLLKVYHVLFKLAQASQPYIAEPVKALIHRNDDRLLLLKTASSLIPGAKDHLIKFLEETNNIKKYLLKLAFTIHSNLVKSACRDEAEIPSELCSFSTFKEFCEECKKLLDVNRHTDTKLSFYKATDTYTSLQKAPVLHEQDALNTQLLEDLKIEEQVPQIKVIVDIADALVSAQSELNNKVEEQNQTPVVKENSLKTYGLFKTTDKENIKEKVGAIKSKIKKHLYKNFYIEEVRDEFSRNKTKRLIEEVNKTKHLQDEFNHKLEQGFQFKNLTEKMKFSKDVHNWLIKSRYGK